MKFIASLLICCIFLLSASGGRVKSAAVNAIEHECCAKGDKHHCTKKDHKPVTEDCEKNGCNMLLTCSICGFLMEEAVKVKPVLSTFIANADTIYILGNSANYFASEWKPPKV